MKRLIVCCDGTWQDLETAYPTNVVRIAQATKTVASDGVPQVVYYDPGLGTQAGNKLLGGALGDGINVNIRETYRFLALNYAPGDEIYLFGFSRGAYTVRSLAGLIRASSIVRREKMRAIPTAFENYRDREIGPDHSEAEWFREKNGWEDKVEIEALCCWDTVGALGIPDLNRFLPFDEFFNRKHEFHDTKVSRMVKHALHALAIDERRKVFVNTPMTRNSLGEPYKGIHQCWFIGDHGGVGGGDVQKVGLSDIALGWMINTLARLRCGLELSAEQIPRGVRPDPHQPLGVEHDLLGVITGGYRSREIHLDGGAGRLHQSVAERWRATREAASGAEPYDPESLAPHAEALDAGEALSAWS